MAEHGAATIKGWMEDLVELARSDIEFDVSAGAEPHRNYAYLEFHLPEGDHSILVFTSEEGVLKAHRVHGPAEEVREKVDRLTHGDRGRT